MPRPQPRAERSSGGKARVHPPSSDNSRIYLDWRYGWGQGRYTNDVDSVEWRVVDNNLVPVAVLELTKHGGQWGWPASPKDEYLNQILQRYHDDGQAAFIQMVANRLRVKAYIVLYRFVMKTGSPDRKFWVYNFARETWMHMDETMYRTWIAALAPEVD